MSRSHRSSKDTPEFYKIFDQSIGNIPSYRNTQIYTISTTTSTPSFAHAVTAKGHSINKSTHRSESTSDDTTMTHTRS